MSTPSAPPAEHRDPAHRAAAHRAGIVAVGGFKITAAQRLDPLAHPLHRIQVAVGQDRDDGRENRRAAQADGARPPDAPAPGSPRRGAATPGKSALATK